MQMGFIPLGAGCWFLFCLPTWDLDGHKPKCDVIFHVFIVSKFECGVKSLDKFPPSMS